MPWCTILTGTYKMKTLNTIRRHWTQQHSSNYEHMVCETECIAACVVLWCMRTQRFAIFALAAAIVVGILWKCSCTYIYSPDLSIVLFWNYSNILKHDSILIDSLLMKWTNMPISSKCSR
jgi:hypothetical protein